jgi:hypothetical protein
MSEMPRSPEQRYLERLKAAKERRAALKMDLVNLRQRLPNTLIFVFEGIDDKAVYYYWVRRLTAELRYEPFVCDGKGKLLDLKDAVDADLNDLSSGIYFFVDRDFDELRGRTQTSNVFLTDRYSIENYLVDDSVLKELLTNDFHCHGQIDLRDRVASRFAALYDDFLAATREINFRLFVARNLKVEPSRPLPAKIGALANVGLTSVTVMCTPEEAVVLKDGEFPDDINELRQKFDELDAKERYRGKFALMFLMAWLDRLAEDYRSDASIFFDKSATKYTVRLERISPGALAAKSNPPIGLDVFLGKAAMAFQERP